VLKLWDPRSNAAIGSLTQPDRVCSLGAYGRNQAWRHYVFDVSIPLCMHACLQVWSGMLVEAFSD